MFDLKKPCKTCPFKVGNGQGFRLGAERLAGIRQGPAFQCHNTVDYEHGPDDGVGFPVPQPGNKPQQCLGLIGVLLNEQETNAITRLALVTGHFDPEKVNLTQCYSSWAEVEDAHLRGREPKSKETKP